VPTLRSVCLDIFLIEIPLQDNDFVGSLVLLWMAFMMTMA